MGEETTSLATSSIEQTGESFLCLLDGGGSMLLFVSLDGVEG